MLLLLLALLLSNILWWRESQANRKAMQGIEAQLNRLQNAVSALEPGPAAKVRTDTVWQTRYVHSSHAGQFLIPTPEEEERTGDILVSRNSSRFYPDQAASHAVSNRIPTQQNYAATTGSEAYATGHTKPNPQSPVEPVVCQGGEYLGSTVPQHIELPALAATKSTAWKTPFSPERLPDSLIRPYDRPNTWPRILLNAVTPKFVKVGLVTGWMHYFSPEWKHQLGFEGGLQGIIGLSRHWAVVLDYTFGELHYESSKTVAILGAPEFKALASPDQHYTHLNLRRQPLQQLDLGLRYTGSLWKNTRPYVGLQWGNQYILPYAVQYEIEDEPNHKLQEGVLYVDNAKVLRNIIRVGAGLEVPVSKHFDLTIEGFYQRQWKPENKNAHSPAGLRLGINRVF